MSPEEIKRLYGIAVLNEMYDIMLQSPVHELCDDILSRMDDKEINKWAEIINKTHTVYLGKKSKTLDN
jgi:hypothetical protein